MKLKSLLGGLAIGALLLSATGQTCYAALTTEQRLADFNELATTFERNYGPLRYKAQSIGLDWEKNKANFSAQVAAVKTDAEFYQTLTRFLGSLQDAHVSVEVPSTYSSKLGFLCDYVNGKVLIDVINTLRLPSSLFPFKRGDQVLEIGGVPVEQLMADLSQYDNTGNAASTKRIAAAHLTSRSQSVGFVVPKGITTIKVLPRGASEPVLVTATWLVSGTPIAELDDLSKLIDSTPIVNTIPTSNEVGAKFSVKHLSLYNLGMAASKVADWKEAGITDLGSEDSMFTLPAGAEPVPSDPLMTAVIYEAGGKKIGILRIPAYENSDPTVDVVGQFIDPLIELEKDTDVLVLDQTNNPGGSVSAASDIAGLFASKTFKDMDFAIRPSMGWLDQFSTINQQFIQALQQDPNDADANSLLPRFQYLEGEVRSAMKEQRFLTAPFSLNLEGTYGYIQPNKEGYHYSKPVLMLINDFDFSGGDLFPAVMKDNGRVTLFGENTTGAGGNVDEFPPLANSYFKYRLTESLMIRPNGEYIENRGVAPDVPYTISEDDFLNGYQNYVLAFTQAALKLIGVDKTIDELAAEQAVIAKQVADKKAADDAAAKAAKDAADAATKACEDAASASPSPSPAPTTTDAANPSPTPAPATDPAASPAPTAPATAGNSATQPANS